MGKRDFTRFGVKLHFGRISYIATASWVVVYRRLVINVMVVMVMSYITLGLYSLSGRTSYRKISRSLEAARLDVSLWNLTGISAVLLSRCLSIFGAIGKVWIWISPLRDITRSRCKTSVRSVNKGPVSLCRHIISSKWLRVVPSLRLLRRTVSSQITSNSTVSSRVC